MLPAEEGSGESSEDPIRLFDNEQTRVLKHSHNNNSTNINPGLTKQVMDIEKNLKSEKRTRRVSSSDSNKRNNVDFKRNTGLIGMKILQKDIIVHDNDDTKVCATGKNRKNNDCLSKKRKDCLDVLEVDVYERIIGKAYENLKTCHKPLEEINVCKMMDNKRPRKVCRSRSLYIPALEKPNKFKKDVLMSYRTPTRTDEIYFKGFDKNYSPNLKNIETITQNQNIEIHPRNKQPISPSIVSQPKKAADTKLMGYNNNLTFKRNIVERKNEVKVTIPNKHVIEVNSKDIGPKTNDCINVTSTSVTKSTNSEKATATKKKIDDQDVSLAPKIAASISKVRRNTISSTCEIIKHTKATKSEKDIKVKRNHTNSNKDQVAMSLVNAKVNGKITKPTNSEKAIEVKNKKIKANSYDNFAVSSLGNTDIKTPNTEKAKEMKRKLEDQGIVSIAPKVAASISKIRRNTISSTCQTVEITKTTKSKKDMGMKTKLTNSNYNDQVTMSNVNAKITKRKHIEKAIEVKNKNNDAYCNDRSTTSSVDTNITKPNYGENIAGLKRKIDRISIDDQVIDSIPLNKAASIFKRRNTISSTCPENSSSLQVCDKTIFRAEKIIPHYHKIFLLNNQTESENETGKRNIVSELRLMRKKTHVEGNAEKTQINIRTNEDYQNCTNTTSLSQSVSLPAGPNKYNDVIEPNEPVDLSLNLVPRLPSNPFPKYDSKINENVPHNLNKAVDSTDRLNIEKLTEGKCDTISCERIPVLLHKTPYPNQRSCNSFSPTLHIQSIVSSPPSQVCHTNNCLFPRSPHTSFSRSSGMRSWRAPYPSHSNDSNRIRDQYPILNRMLNARAFAGNPYFYRTLTQLPVFEQPRQYLPSPPRLYSPCSPSNILITNQVKHRQQFVNNAGRKPAIHNKVNKCLSESSAVQNAVSPEATIADMPPDKCTPVVNQNVLNNGHKMSPTEQSSNEKKCNESKSTCKKEYSPPILPILSYATIISILENSEYDYPYLRSSVFKSPSWMYKETANQPNLDKNKSGINDGGTQDKKTKITLSEYNMRRLSETSCKND